MVWLSNGINALCACPVAKKCAVRTKWFPSEQKNDTHKKHIASAGVKCKTNADMSIVCYVVKCLSKNEQHG